MRVVSALIAPSGKPAAIYNAWVEGKIYASDVCGASRRTTSDAAEAARRRTHQTVQSWSLVNQIKRLAQDIDPLPPVERSPDPTDDFLLALSEAVNAEYLVTGDKSGLLALSLRKAIKIVSAAEFLALLA